MRSSIFLERAIVSERIRLAMGLSLRPVTESVSATEDLEHSVIADKYYEPPLINVIKFACNKCPEKIIKVTSMCQGCLAHPCQEVCPKKAISFRNGRSHIDQDLCIKCGRCVTTCPYNAIVKVERPCAKACGVGAIRSDEHGRADIDYNKCVSCGMCLVNCPFGAIVDKGQIFQLIQSIKRGDEVIAIVAPAFVNQFPNMTPAKLREAMKRRALPTLQKLPSVLTCAPLMKRMTSWRKFPPSTRSWEPPAARRGALWPRRTSPSLLTASAWP
mgnify:CR=1 FL=1